MDYLWAHMMSKKAKYGILALVHLARKNDDKPMVTRDIAAAENIPPKFLESIMLDLKKAAILSSKKGAGGGYYLHKKPEDINLAEVIRIFDGPIALLPCVTHTYYERCDECRDEDICGIRDVFTELRKAAVEILKKATIAEILRREQVLQLLFKK